MYVNIYTVAVAAR